MMHSGHAGLLLPDSTFGTTVNTYLAFGNNPGILPVEISITAGVGVATTMPNIGNSSSLFASTSPDPLVIMGPAAPIDGGS